MSNSSMECFKSLGGRRIRWAAVVVLILCAFVLTSCMSAREKAEQAPSERGGEMGPGGGPMGPGAPGMGGMPGGMGGAGGPLASMPSRPSVVAKRAQSAFDVGAPPSDSGTSEFSLMIIKTADVTIKVKNIELAGNQVIELARSAGGFVTSSSFSQGAGDDEPTGTMTVKVPVHAFESLLTRIGRIGEVKSRSVSGEDVTGQVSDLESRLRNKRAEEAQYLEIMHKAKRIPDIITVSNELFRVRGDIEQLVGRIKYLRSASDMSTITLTLEQTGKRAVKGIPAVLKHALASLKHTSIALLAVVIWLAVYSPYWIVLLVLGFWLRGRIRARRV